MQFSNIFIASLLAAIASAETATPARRGLTSLSKRAATDCGKNGRVCCSANTYNGMHIYADCDAGQTCQQFNNQHYCCPSGSDCTSHVTSCDGYKCGTGLQCMNGPDGAPACVPNNQAQVVSAAVAVNSATAAANSAVASATEAAASAASSIEANASAVVSSVQAEGSAAVSAVTASASEAVASASASASAAVASASGAAASAASGAAATATGTSGAPPAPTQAVSDASKIVSGTVALALALLTSMLML